MIHAVAKDQSEWRTIQRRCDGLHLRPYRDSAELMYQLPSAGLLSAKKAPNDHAAPITPMLRAACPLSRVPL
jgi:hypothetical protein